MFRFNTFITFANRITILLFKILRSIIAARALGAHGRGVLAIIYITSQICALIIEAGLSLANVYFLGKKKYTEGEVYLNSIISTIIFSTIVIILFTIFYENFPTILGNFNRSFMYMALSVIPLSLIYQYSATIFQGKSQLVTYNIIKIIEPFTFFIVFVILVEFVRLEIKGAIYANIIGYIVASIISIILVLRIKGFKLKYNKFIFKDSLKFGVKGHIGNIGTLLNYRMDIYMVQYFIGIEYVGYYIVSVNIAEGLYFIPTSLATVLFPIVASNSRDNINKFTAVVCRNTIFLCLVGGIILFTLSWIIVRYGFGPYFIDSILPLRILIPGIIAMSITKVINSYLIGSGKPALPSIVNWLMILINLPVNILLIPKWGIAGAAVASTFSYSIGMVILLFVFSEVSGVSIYDAVIIKKDDFRYYSEFGKRILVKITRIGKTIAEDED